MAQLTVPRARRMVLAMKAETTYGTDAFAGTYTSADIIPAFNIVPDARMTEVPNLSMFGDLGRLPSVMAEEVGSLSFSMYLRGAGAAYAANVKPECDRPLQGCMLIGVGSFTAGAEKWTYQPGTPQSYTLYATQENGRTLKLVGAYGTMDLTMRAGGVLEARFVFTGKVGGVADVSWVAGTVSGPPPYPQFKSAAFQIGTANYAPRIATVGLALGNVVSPAPSINDATGVGGFFISDRNPRITIDPEANAVANFDWYGLMKAGTLNDVTFQCGTEQYNRVKFNFNASSAAQVQIVATSWGTRDGLTSSPATLLATINAGADDLALVFD